MFVFKTRKSSLNALQTSTPLTTFDWTTSKTTNAINVIFCIFNIVHCIVCISGMSVFIVFSFIVIDAFSASHSLTGRVINKRGAPLFGCTVSLLGSNLSDTTNFNGIFSINVSSLHTVRSESYSGTVISNTHIKISIQQPLTASFRILDLTGRLVFYRFGHSGRGRSYSYRKFLQNCFMA